jgi:hypothetical protein
MKVEPFPSVDKRVYSTAQAAKHGFCSFAGQSVLQGKQAARPCCVGALWTNRATVRALRTSSPGNHAWNQFVIELCADKSVSAEGASGCAWQAIFRERNEVSNSKSVPKLP